MCATSTCARSTAKRSTSPADRVLAFLAASTLVGAATFAGAQTNPDRGALLRSLAESLGRQHYLRTLCRGDDDQTWRLRMSRLLDVEAPSSAERDRLTAAFNRGFNAFSATHAECGAPARDAASANAREAARLSSALASAPESAPQSNGRSRLR